MTTVNNNPAEVLRQVVQYAMLDLHTAQPGIIESYDANTQTADIRIGNLRVIPARNDDDEDTVEQMPVLLDVPVLWPRAGDFFIHFPLAAGDTVLLVFCEQDTNQWRNTGSESDPGTPERHGLSGAVAIPGYAPRDASIGDADGSNGRIGSDGGPFVEFRPSEIRVGGANALAEAAALDAFESAMNAFVPPTTTPGDNGAALLAAIKAVFSTPGWVNKATTVTKGD